MARHEKNKTDGGRVKLRIIDFELDGSDSTLLEGLRGIANTLARNQGSIRAIPARLVEPVQPPSGTSTEEKEEEEAEKAEDSAATSEAKPERVSATRPPRRVSNPKILKDLDLVSGTVTLKDFCDKKQPDGDSKRYLVITAWLKEHREISPVTQDHIHTCYRHLGWHTPKDVLLVFRSLKQQGWVVSGEKRGTFEIVHTGENVVNKMPKKAS